MSRTEIDRRIAVVRRFNRFYTQQIGILHESLLDSRFSLTEGRIVYELAQIDETTAGELARQLGLDAGYLSRILRRLRQGGLVERTQSTADARRMHLSLTAAGRRAYAAINKRSYGEIGAMLKAIAPSEQNRLVGAMASIENLLGEGRTDDAIVLRSHMPGDSGWVISRHAALYAEEYGWDGTFEALVATIAADFIETNDPARERCWIAELDGAPMGSVMVVAKSKTVAKLRLLLVEPRARGLGIGRRLVIECLRFAKRVGYRRMTLWTNSNLDAARHIYERLDFDLTDEKPHLSFGHDLVGETWERSLADVP
jgi:DNA-binding MarR family transcriptional regulator/N-acetylglutamate synthase-like GNAT family acetyltransferase